MVQYKLTYFNARGRAETARMIFVAADQKFDDVRIDAEEWQSRKKDFKNGKLPVLDIGIGIGSEQLTQSVAIIKYLGGLFGYAGKSTIDAARCHAMVETMRDIFYPVTTRVFSEKDQQKRGEIIKEIAPELKRFLTMFEDLTKANESGFLVGSHVSFADFELFTIVTTIENLLGADSIKEFPHIVKNRQLIVALPKLKEYLAKLAKTEF